MGLPILIVLIVHKDVTYLKINANYVINYVSFVMDNIKIIALHVYLKAEMNAYIVIKLALRVDGLVLIVFHVL